MPIKTTLSNKMTKKTPLETAALSYSDAESAASSNFLDEDGILQEQQKEAEAQQRKSLANKESTAIFWLRLTVFFFLFCTAVLVSGGVYFYATTDEEEAFESAFEIHATKMIESFRDSFDRKTGAMGAMANSMTNYAMKEVEDGNPGFPFITTNNFAVLGNDLRVQTDALTVAYSPLVTEENRLAWEEYAFMHKDKVLVGVGKDAYYRQEEDELYGLGGAQEEDNQGTRKLQGHPNILPGTNYHLRIWDITRGNNASIEGSGPYLPVWQGSPGTGGQMLNMNWGTSKGLIGIYRDIIQRDPKVVINKAVVPVALGQERIKALVKLGQFRHETGSEYLDDPTSFLFYPIFDGFNKTQRDLAGYLVVQLYWRLFFVDILPKTAKGIICVIENSYNQTLSYQVDGSEATFLGEGDFHDAAYDSMVMSEDITNYVNDKAGPETRAFMTVPLHDTIGVHKLHVYPTQVTEDEYKSNEPIIYTVVVCSVFLLTAAVFLLFNWYVERRQRIVMNRAVQAGAVVSSLFPEQVQERLYETNAGHKSKGKGKDVNTWKREEASESYHPFNETADETVKRKERNGGQIADFYSETTIMFADLAGFTQWSSGRSPSDVFELLETLYSAFDKAAMRRGVFKVETIGDCYLAACGLPDPNPAHAVIMAKFAQECINRMELIVRKVSDRLGAETADLKLRAGLHSGSTVAGILRGQKSRFQLFGDTVNTAARMESTGEPGRIQVSESTADQLTSMGRGSWLVPREDRIVPKGKGEMTTYWVCIQSEGSVTPTYSIGSGVISNTGLDMSTTEPVAEDDIYKGESTETCPDETPVYDTVVEV